MSEWEVWFAWHPVYFDGQWHWLKRVRRLWSSTANSYGAESRDVTWRWAYSQALGGKK